MVTVLDIDLDLFVDPRTTGTSPKRNGRPVDVEGWNCDRVMLFLQSAFTMDQSQRLPGKCFESHDQVLHALERIAAPIHLFHLDAHADLGIGQDCYEFYSAFLALDQATRRKRLHDFTPREGDFLLYALACGFVEKVDYVTHPSVYLNEPDIPIGMDRWEIKYDRGWIDVRRFFGSRSEYCNREGERVMDRSIPIRMHNRDGLIQQGIAFDYLFMTHSPKFTPPSLDTTYHALVELLIR